MSADITAASADLASKRVRASAKDELDFAEAYRANVEAITNYFARRCTDPQAVADLTSETFVRAVGSLGTFDPGVGSPRAWLFGIARNVNARHCASLALGNEMTERLGAQIELTDNGVEELAARIDAQDAGRRLLAACRSLPQLERSAVELVDLAGLTPKEAAASLGVSSGVLRARLFRARARLRKDVGYE